MNANVLPWDDLRLALAIGRVGTLAGAARALGLNHSTVFRRLGALEQRIGVRLFDRFRDGYAATAAGEELIALAGRVDTGVIALERRLAGRDLRPSGRIRATTTDTLVELVAPMLASFRDRHPEISLELAASNELFNLSRRDADVAIRPAQDPPEMLVGRRVATVSFAAYAAPAYLKRRPARLPLDQQDWVAPDDSLAHIPPARWLDANVPAERVVFRANTLVALLHAARAGLGLALLPSYLGGSEPRLRRVGGKLPALDGGLWLLTHPDLRRVARIRAFLDFMAPALAREVPLLSDRSRR